jgi:hypothetical protein
METGLPPPPLRPRPLAAVATSVSGGAPALFLPLLPPLSPFLTTPQHRRPSVVAAGWLCRPVPPPPSRVLATSPRPPSARSSPLLPDGGRGPLRRAGLLRGLSCSCWLFFRRPAWYSSPPSVLGPGGRRRRRLCRRLPPSAGFFYRWFPRGLPR